MSVKKRDLSILQSATTDTQNPDDYQPPRSNVVAIDRPANPPLLSAQGRIGRVRFLGHSLWMSLLLCVVGLMLSQLLYVASASLEIVGIGIMLIAFASINTILCIKRCHDFDVSGWFALLAWVPGINIGFALMPGTQGSNRFGSAPTKNTLPIIVSACFVPLLAIAAVGAAMAVPTLQHDAARTAVIRSLAFAEVAKTKVKERLAENGGAEGRITERNDVSGMEAWSDGEGYATVVLIGGTGKIVLTVCSFKKCATEIEGRKITLTPRIENGSLVFDCRSREITQKYLPDFCVGL